MRDPTTMLSGSLIELARSAMRLRRVESVLSNNLTLGYNVGMISVNQAASLMGRRSVEARLTKWGEQEFRIRMRKWGKLGGRPKGSGKKQKKGKGRAE